MTRDAGVTLIEMLVALAIFAVIGVAGFTVLDTVVRTGDRTDGRLEALQSVDRALTVFDRDMTEALPGSLTADPGALRLRRPVGEDMADVTYRLAEGRLLREIGGEAAEPVTQTLLQGVAAAELRLLDAAGDWQGPDTLDRALPPFRAVELTLTLSPALAGRRAGDTVRRVVALAAPVDLP